MARAEIDLTVTTVSGTGRMSGLSGASITVYARNTDGTNGSLATVYTTPNLGTTAANPITSDAAGRINGWLDQGSYNLVVAGTGISTYTQPWEAMPASGITVGAGAIGTTQLADGSVTSVKLASDGAVDANRAVQTNHIRDAQITTAKILDANVTTNKLANGAVTLVKRAVTPSCRLSHTIDQTVTASGTITLAWNTEGHDTDTMHDTVTNNSRLIFTTAGVYSVLCSLSLGNVQSGDSIQFRLNGATVVAKVSAGFAAGPVLYYQATAADYFEVQYIASATVSTRTVFNTVSSFSAALISP